MKTCHSPFLLSPSGVISFELNSSLSVLSDRLGKTRASQKQHVILSFFCRMSIFPSKIKKEEAKSIFCPPVITQFSTLSSSKNFPSGSNLSIIFLFTRPLKITNQKRQRFKTTTQSSFRDFKGN